VTVTCFCCGTQRVTVTCCCCGTHRVTVICRCWATIRQTVTGTCSWTMFGTQTWTVVVTGAHSPQPVSQPPHAGAQAPQSWCRLCPHSRENSPRRPPDEPQLAAAE